MFASPTCGSNPPQMETQLKGISLLLLPRKMQERVLVEKKQTSMRSTRVSMQLCKHKGVPPMLRPEH